MAKHVGANVSSVQYSGKNSSDYFHDTTPPVSTPNDVEALQSAYLETTNENSNN